MKSCARDWSAEGVRRGGACLGESTTRYQKHIRPATNMTNEAFVPEMGRDILSACVHCICLGFRWDLWVSMCAFVWLHRLLVFLVSDIQCYVLGWHDLSLFRLVFLG